MGLSDKDFEFLRESPEHAIWLERNIEPRFWLKLKSLEAESLEFQDKVAPKPQDTAQGRSLGFLVT
jgi:hypothetical protein